ncbi:alpha/beta hydrolase-fold protein [Mucilaginibacter calamicampi]|uniref:Alpha/beta hydrolase-fold protein n=1 Tax=Mucilaginibacter calamicampi TaxID=1302352 RepID=A0ABW2YXE4_9SPHI
MQAKAITLLLFIFGYTLSAFCQTKLEGQIVNSASKSGLRYVNIGIKGRNIGTISKENGFFAINIPPENITDTLTFSLIGYGELSIPLQQLTSNEKIKIQLVENTTMLKEALIRSDKLVERKFGIRNTGALLHFTDGIFKKDDSFEIGQVIDLGARPGKITSLNIHINSSRPDSATFRINFYQFDEDHNTPGPRIFNKSIVQRHPIKEGWLKFDVSEYNIRLKGKVFASIEFIPENKDVNRIIYEVKLGGASKSFFRKSSLGQWTRPPHHYCIYVTALTDKNVTDEYEVSETAPTIVLQSDFSAEKFNIYVKLPKGYAKETKAAYPVIYLLDGNAYFDQMAVSIDQLFKKKKLRSDAILVGIGYENAYVMDSLRARDYTFPTSPPPDNFGISGQGANFYNFIKLKLITEIDTRYRTDKANRTIMGHSLGGYFVLFSLLHGSADTAVFNNYIAASPSLSYHDGYLFKQFEARNTDLTGKSLYLTMGELEIKEDKDNSFTNLSGLLKSRTLKIKPQLYNGLAHMGTAIPSFEDGIAFVLGK